MEKKRMILALGLRGRSGSDFMMPQKRKKRQYTTRNAKGVLTVKFTQPGEEEECPVVMETMANYRAPFAPDASSWFEDSPELSKATLPCKHSFSSMALLFHFARNHMCCPVCRQGHDEPMSPQSFPVYLRQKLAAYLTRMRDEDNREQETEDARWVAATFASEIQVGIHSHVQTHRIMLGIRVYDISGLPVTAHVSMHEETSSFSLAQRAPTSSRSSISESSDVMVFSTSGYAMRLLNSSFLSLDIERYQLEICSVAIVSDAIRVLVTSEPMSAESVHQEGGSLILPLPGESELTVFSSARGIMRVYWRVTAREFVTLMVSFPFGV